MKTATVLSIVVMTFLLGLNWRPGAREADARSALVLARAEFVRACALRVRLGYDTPDACAPQRDNVVDVAETGAH